MAAEEGERAQRKDGKDRCVVEVERVVAQIARCQCVDNKYALRVNVD